MATKPMELLKRIKKHLDEGYEVILKKDSEGVHPVSFSRVTKIDGESVLRTAFEALSVSDTYNFRVARYSLDGILENTRVHFYCTGKKDTPVSKFGSNAFNNIEDDDDDDRDEDEDDDCEVEVDRDDSEEEEDEIQQPVFNPVPSHQKKTPIQTVRRGRVRTIRV